MVTPAARREGAARASEREGDCDRRRDARGLGQDTAGARDHPARGDERRACGAPLTSVRSGQSRSAMGHASGRSWRLRRRGRGVRGGSRIDECASGLWRRSSSVRDSREHLGELARHRWRRAARAEACGLVAAGGRSRRALGLRRVPSAWGPARTKRGAALRCRSGGEDTHRWHSARPSRSDLANHGRATDANGRAALAGRPRKDAIHARDERRAP